MVQTASTFSETILFVYDASLFLRITIQSDVKGGCIRFTYNI